VLWEKGFIFFLVLGHDDQGRSVRS